MWLSWLFFWRPPCVYRRVIVNFKHDSTEAFQGLLWSYRWGWVTLREATALKAGVAPERIPGDVVVHRSAIAYIQVLT